MTKNLFFLLMLALLLGCQSKKTNKVIIDENAIASREIVTDFELFEFINPKFGAQIAAIADSCLDDDYSKYLILTIMPADTLYVKMPDVDPEKGARYNAKLETYNNDYYDIEIDSSFFSSQKTCVKLGKRLCFVHMWDDVPEIVKPTGKHYTDRHYTNDYVCPCMEQERMLLIGDNGTIQKVYPEYPFVPDGLIDTILVEYPDEEPVFPNNGQTLEQFIAKYVDWPENLNFTIANFTVEIDGRVSNVEAPPSVREPEARAFVESLHKILPMMPRWEPGKIQGKTVRSKSCSRLRRSNKKNDSKI